MCEYTIILPSVGNLDSDQTSEKMEYIWWWLAFVSLTSMQHHLGSHSNCFGSHSPILTSAVSMFGLSVHPTHLSGDDMHLSQIF